MLFWDMLNETLYEFHNGNGFFHVLIIFVSVIVKSDKVTILKLKIGNTQKTNVIEKGISTVSIEWQFISGIKK